MSPLLPVYVHTYPWSRAGLEAVDLSPEKQKMYDIKRLRLIVACFHFAIAALLFLFLMKSDLAATLFLSIVAVLSVAAVVLANTWAKKK